MSANAQTLNYVMALINRARLLAKLDPDSQEYAELHDEWLANCESLLKLPSEQAVREVQELYVNVCADIQKGYDLMDLFSEALEAVSETVSDNGLYRLFALPMLMPLKDAMRSLTDEEYNQMAYALQESGLISEGALVGMVPLLIPFEALSSFDEWSIARVSNLLFSQSPDIAAEFIKERVVKVEGGSGQSDNPNALAFLVLVGMAASFDEPESESEQESEGFSSDAMFGTHHAVFNLLDSDDEHATEEAFTTLNRHLSTATVLIKNALGLKQLEVFNEPQGYWDDMELGESVLRDIALHQQLASVEAKTGAKAEDLWVVRTAVHREGQNGLYFRVFQKRDLVFVGELYFGALHSEDPDECWQEALSSFASAGLTIIDEALLATAAQSNGTSGENEDPDEAAIAGWLH